MSFFQQEPRRGYMSMLGGQMQGCNSTRGQCTGTTTCSSSTTVVVAAAIPVQCPSQSMDISILGSTKGRQGPRQILARTGSAAATIASFGGGGRHAAFVSNGGRQLVVSIL